MLQMAWFREDTEVFESKGLLRGTEEYRYTI